MIKRLFILFLVAASLAAAQGVRFSSQVSQQGTVSTSTNAVVLPANPQISFCNFPANAVPCTNKATTYTNATLLTSCSTSTQIVLDGTTACTALPDAQNNWGVWLVPGQYVYTITLPGGINLGPYFVTASLPTNPNVQVIFNGGLDNPNWIVGRCLQEAMGGPVTTSGPCGTSSGTLTATGSPVAAEISCFSAPTSITNCNLSGDVTTTNTAATTIANGVVTGPKLAAQYSKFECIPGLGDGFNAIAIDTYIQFSCVNKSGVTWTITGISCWSDNNGTSNLSAANNAATALLTGAVTCNNTKSGGGAAGTQSATTTLANNDAITFTFNSDGTTKTTSWTVTFTQ